MAKTPLKTSSGIPPVALPTRIAGKARAATTSTGLDRGQPLRKDNLSPANQSVANWRYTRTAPELMRNLAEGNGLASTALINLMSMADSGYFLKAYTTWTQDFSREGLLAAETIISALDTNWDYSKGYADRRGLSLQVETALWEVAQTGGIGLEVVLDSYRLPRDIVLFAYDQVEWRSNGRSGKYPVQKPAAGEAVELNFPNIFVAESVKSADRNYTLPFIVSGIQQLIQYQDFVEDMWRVVRRAGEPRIVVTLNYDKVVQSASPEIAGDADKLSTYLEDTRSQIETLLTGLAPEDALVTYDLAVVDKIEGSGEKRDFKELLSELSGQAASGLKSNASLMGLRLAGSQNVASVEAMISTMVARRIQLPVEEVLSRALTLAVRLYGVDAFVKFCFRPINLRPHDELAAHRAMNQANVLELLSLGLVTNDEAQVMLGLGSLPEGAPELAGTGFYKNRPLDTMPASGTNARNASIAPQGPSSAGGGDNESRP